MAMAGPTYAHPTDPAVAWVSVQYFGSTRDAWMSVGISQPWPDLKALGLALFAVSQVKLGKTLFTALDCPVRPCVASPTRNQALCARCPQSLIRHNAIAMFMSLTSRAPCVPHCCAKQVSGAVMSDAVKSLTIRGLVPVPLG